MFGQGHVATTIMPRRSPDDIYYVYLVYTVGISSSTRASQAHRNQTQNGTDTQQARRVGKSRPPCPRHRGRQNVYEHPSPRVKWGAPSCTSIAYQPDSPSLRASWVQPLITAVDVVTTGEFCVMFLTELRHHTPLRLSPQGGGSNG